jgi:hypothetical protein
MMKAMAEEGEGEERRRGQRSREVDQKKMISPR